jgi:hypothetical protein
MPQKIAIAGKFRTGKDTLAGLLTEALPGPTITLRFADALKYEVAHMVYDYTHPDQRDGIVYTHPDQRDGIVAGWKTGWEAVGTYRSRVAEFAAEMAKDRKGNPLSWQWWGDWRRDHTDLDYWINHTHFQSAYQNALESGANILVADVRRVNEAEWCRSHGFYLVRIKGPCRLEGERRDPNHSSEVDVDEVEVDTVIDNSGDLYTLKGIAQSLVWRLQHLPQSRYRILDSSGS